LSPYLPSNPSRSSFPLIYFLHSATTHTDLLLRARELSIPSTVIHNASIMNAMGACGLQLYNFGQTVSLVFFTDTWKPDSFYDRVKENWERGMHTLVLLDIKVREQSEENMARCVRFSSFSLLEDVGVLEMARYQGSVS
jgi:diphthine synthase